ncbi:MAG TPA: zinc-binding alcohol dehydrogenase family protein [Polyangia bacterium]|nr:zinc-binding alcohol dehydrogenase family protein [Polyangia bacterium]
MKALFITAPGKTEIREIARPEPGRGEVRVRVRYLGYCGSDLNTFRGLNPLVSYPRVPGHEVAGVIDAVGPEVPDAFAPGVPVLLVPYTSCGTCSACRKGRPNACRNNQTLGVQRDGALAEQVVVPVAKLLTSRHLSLRDMVLVEPLSVGWHAARRGRVATDETVVVFGCGMVGLGAIASAAAAGARVVAVDVDDGKLAIGRAAGAVVTINSTTEDLHQLLQALTENHGPDLLIEGVGLPATYRACVEEVCFAGRVVYVGYAKESVEYATKNFVMKEIDIMGSRNATPDDFRGVIAYLEAGRFPVDAVITHVVPFAEAGAALAMWANNPKTVTKIVVDFGG